ncbi:MAG: PaaI family thioesterase, partial [Gammaproteobacteria bacterium]
MALTVDEANRRAAQCLPGLLGLEFTHLEKGLTRAQMAVRAQLLAPHGFLHGGSVVGLADTAC